jgi:ABC-type molybdate transport system substrate-binding protein
MKLALCELSLFVVLCFASATALADEVQAAVAANFTAPMQKIALEFEKDTTRNAQLVFDSTAKFYVQIRNGSPFEILLAVEAIKALAEFDFLRPKLVQGKGRDRITPAVLIAYLKSGKVKAVIRSYGYDS